MQGYKDKISSTLRKILSLSRQMKGVRIKCFQGQGQAQKTMGIVKYFIEKSAVSTVSCFFTTRWCESEIFFLLKIISALDLLCPQSFILFRKLLQKLVFIFISLNICRMGVNLSCQRISWISGFQRISTHRSAHHFQPTRIGIEQVFFVRFGLLCSIVFQFRNRVNQTSSYMHCYNREWCRSYVYHIKR